MNSIDGQTNITDYESTTTKRWSKPNRTKHQHSIDRFHVDPLLFILFFFFGHCFKEDNLTRRF